MSMSISVGLKTNNDKTSNDKRGNGAMRVFENKEELATDLGYYVSELSEAAVKERGAFAVALSGGVSVIDALGKLTEAPYIKTVDWAKWHMFWVDECVVAKNHPDSNYKLVKEGLLCKGLHSLQGGVPSKCKGPCLKCSSKQDGGSSNSWCLHFQHFSKEDGASSNSRCSHFQHFSKQDGASSNSRCTHFQHFFKQDGVTSNNGSSNQVLLNIHGTWLRCS